MTKDRKIAIALTIYLTALFASNTLGIKFMPFIFGTHLSTAIFAFPFVFLMTDVVGEVYGKSLARTFVRMGLYSMIVFLIFNTISNFVPTDSKFFMKDAYTQIFGLSFRFTLASLVAFIIGEYQDVFTFFLLKDKLGNKWFGFRSFVSNLWGQLLDSSIWYMIAFWGVYPFGTIVLMLVPWWLFKVAAGVVYTPLSYLGIRLLKSHESTSN